MRTKGKIRRLPTLTERLVEPIQSPSTLNLSSKDLPPEMFSLLDKGKGFCPTPRNYDTFALINDATSYTRRCRLREYFNDQTMPENDIPKKLYIGSDWTPSTGQDPALDLYCSNIEKDASMFIPPKSVTDNLPRPEREYLYALRNDQSLTTRQADKGGRMVVMDTVDYNESINTMLSNDLVYKQLDEDPTLEIHKRIADQIRKLESAEIVSSKLASNILAGELVCPHFYGLPKIHKPTPEGKRLPPFREPVSSVKGLLLA